MALRIIAGALRGRVLKSPAGMATRPTGQRMRQAIFDMLAHAPWGGRALLEGATVLDGFAGTGALGLEALSRGAAQAVFIECDANALAILHGNVAACGMRERSRVVAADMARPPAGEARNLVFLDPPYDRGLLAPACAALRRAGWIVPGTIIIAETARHEQVENQGMELAQKAHGAAKMNVWRET